MGFRAVPVRLPRVFQSLGPIAALIRPLGPLEEAARVANASHLVEKPDTCW